MIPPVPPKTSPLFSTQGGASWGLAARPPARFSSLSNPKKHINTNEPKHESETACLLRPLRCLFSVSQRAKALQVDGMDGEFCAPERNPSSRACACSLGSSYRDPHCQGCCDQYRARYRRHGHRCRLFAVCVVIFAHRMKPPTPNRQPETMLSCRKMSPMDARWRQPNPESKCTAPPENGGGSRPKE
jgi:hypothetical protein